MPPLFSAHGGFPQVQMDFQALQVDEVLDRKFQFSEPLFIKVHWFVNKLGMARAPFRIIALSSSAPTIQEEREFPFFVSQDHPERLLKI